MKHNTENKAFEIAIRRDTKCPPNLHIYKTISNYYKLLPNYPSLLSSNLGSGFKASNTK